MEGALETFFSILVFVFMLAILVTGAAIVRPFSRLFPNRKQAALIHLMCWLGMLVSAGAAGSLDPEIQREIAADRKEEQRKEVLKAQAEQKAAKEKLAGEAVKLQAEAKGLWAGILSAAKPCDDASSKVAKSFSNSSNAYALYPVVKSAKDICLATSMALGDLKPPASASGEVLEGFEKALDECKTTYGTRSYALGQVLDVVNGEGRPSDVQEAVEAMEIGNQAPLRCVAQFASALGKTGLPNDVVLKILDSKN